MPTLRELGEKYYKSINELPKKYLEALRGARTLEERERAEYLLMEHLLELEKKN